jgi:3-oxoacyl-[acyl-carrier protein] reductase
VDLEVGGKGYLVMGGTSGMGLATARVLVEEGASVVMTGRDRQRADRAADSLKGLAGQASALTVDVHDGRAVDQVVSEAVAVLGRLDGVAVMTGVIGHEPMTIDDEAWKAVFDDVMLGTVRTVRAALPHMPTPGGTVVTTAAYSVRAPHPERLPYASLKSAVAAFTKGIAKQYGEQGIRANCICPGAIETEPLHALRVQLAAAREWPVEEAIERVMVEEWHMDVALRRPGQPREVGELAAFLLSSRAGYLTGALINIDGGTYF